MFFSFVFKGMKRPSLWLGGLLLFFLVFSLNPLFFQSLSENEGSYLLAAKQSLSDLLQRNAQDQSPVYFLLLHYWMRLAGTSEFVLRAPSLFFALGAIFFVYQIGILLGGFSVGFLAALLTALSPLVLGMAQEVRHWTLFLFLSVLSLFFLIRYLREGRPRDLGGFFLSFLISAYTCFYALIHFFSVCLFLICCVRIKTKSLLLVLLALAAASLPQWLQLRQAVGFAGMQGTAWGIPKQFPIFFQVAAEKLFGGGGIGLAFFLIGILRSDWKAALFALFWIVPFLWGNYHVAGVMSVRPHYFITLVPVCSLLMASSLLGLRRKGLGILCAILLTGISFPSLKPSFSAFIQGEAGSHKEDWRGALRYVRERFRRNDIVLLIPGWAIEVFKVYSDLPVVQVSELGLERFLHYRRAWVVSFDQGEFEDEPYPVVGSARFRRIGVRLYDLHPRGDFVPEPARGSYNFREHLREARIGAQFIKGGELRYSIWKEEGEYLGYRSEMGPWGQGLMTQRWEPPKNLMIPEEPWKTVAVSRHKSGGELRPVIWAHPVQGGVLTITYPEVPLDKAINGFVGLTDTAVKEGKAPVHFEIRIGGETVFRTLKANQPSWKDFSVATDRWRGSRQSVSFSIFSAPIRWRHFCFNAWVDDRLSLPSSPRFSFRLVKTIKDPEIRWPKSVRISPDGRLAYVQNLDARNTMVFDTQTFERLKLILHEGKPVETLFTHGGRYLWISYLALIGEKYPPYRLEWTEAKGWDTEYRFPSVVVVYDRKQEKLVHRIGVGVRPKVVAATPDERYVFVSNWSSDSVSVIDTNEFKAVKEIKVGLSPRGMAFSKDGRRAYVAVMRGQALAVIDVKQLKLLRLIQKGIAAEPRHLVRNRRGDRLYISANGSALIQVMDLAREEVIQNIQVGLGPRTIVLSPDEKWLYAVNYGSATVSVVDLARGKEAGELKTSETPVGIDVTPDGRYLWVTCYRAHQIMIFERL